MSHKALVVVEPGVSKVQDKPLPELRPDTVLIKVHAVALNPTDWKHRDNLLKPGSSSGSDFAGVVTQIGAEAEGKGFKVGDPVAGFTRGGFIDNDNGSFQEYVRQLPELIWHKPGNISFEDAAPMGGIALSTAAQALFYRLDLPKPWAPASESKPILIWSGATGVGMYAIQLAKASGWTVAATASPKNHALLKSLGADAVFDYRDPKVSHQLKEWGGKHGGIRHALDAISEHGSTKLIVKAFSEDGGKVIRILTLKEEVEGIPSNVEAVPILIYSVLKKKNEKDFTDMAEWYSQLPKLIETGKIKPVPRKHFEGGFKALTEALEYLKAGKASGEKLTLTLAE